MQYVLQETVTRNTSLFSRENKKQKLVTKKEPKKHVSYGN